MANPTGPYMQIGVPTLIAALYQTAGYRHYLARFGQVCA
jgi:hypothetical protein